MNFETKTVASKPGLSQEEALLSLQDSSVFARGTKIASLRRRDDRWVAVLHIPKTAGGPPFGNESESEDTPMETAPKGEEKEEDSSEDSPEDMGGEFPPKDEEGDEKKPDFDHEVLNLLHQILMAVGGGPTPDAGLLGGPDDHGMGAGPGPAGGHPPGLPPAPKAKLKPGEVPPGVTPIGAPAFSSVQTLGKVRSFTASKETSAQLHEAEAELNSAYGSQGYSVKQIKRDGEHVRALLSR